MSRQRKKPDYAHKSVIMKTDLPKIERETGLALYAHEVFLNEGVIIKIKYSYETALDLRFFYAENFPDDWKEAERINDASYHRVKRLKERISVMLLKPCVFLTLTFTDEVLANTSKKTRKAYVKRFLGSLNCAYVANIDYGEENGREHYHALVQAEKIDYKPWHKYGAIKGERVRLDFDKNGKCLDEVRPAKYISKLTNHAIKETCKRSCIMYSRETRKTSLNQA